MTLRQLEYVVALADTLSFRRAAEKCLVSQPSLSSQLQELERMLGVQLFERDKRKVLVTRAGEEFVKRARVVLLQVDDLAGSTASFKDPVAGAMHLGVIPTIAPYMLPVALPLLRERYPELRVLLCEEQTDGLVGLAARGKLDVLLLAMEADLGDLERRPLFTDPLVVVLPSDHVLCRKARLKAADLQGQDLLLLSEGHCLRGQTEPICRSVGACELAEVRAMSLSTLVQMVAGGLGLTLLPIIALDSELRGRKGLAFRPFSDPQPNRTVGLAWRRSSSSHHEARFRLLGEVLKTVGEKLIGQGAATIASGARGRSSGTPPRSGGARAVRRDRRRGR